MNELGLIIQNDKVVVSSRKVAEVYEKAHKHVLDSIRTILIDVSEAQPNFRLSEYKDSTGRSLPEYLMDRQGFSMLVMGFTGEKARRFTYQYTQAFEHMANQLKPQSQELSPQLQVLINMELKQKELESSIADTQAEVKTIREVISINPKAEWRNETNKILTAIGKKNNDYIAPKKEVYDALKVRAGCRPDVLVANLKKRALANGMAPSKVGKINMLDVLENDLRLKEIYVSIVKEMAIRYGA